MPYKEILYVSLLLIALNETKHRISEEHHEEGENFSSWEQWGSGKGLQERLYSLQLWRFPMLVGQRPEQPGLPLLSTWDLTGWPPALSSNLNRPMRLQANWKWQNAKQIKDGDYFCSLLECSLTLYHPNKNKLERQEVSVGLGLKILLKTLFQFVTAYIFKFIWNYFLVLFFQLSELKKTGL